MKATNAHRASELVSAASKMEQAAKKLLSEESSELVEVKVEHRCFSRRLADVTIPATYIAKALQEYREALVLEAETLGVEFPASDGDSHS